MSGTAAPPELPAPMPARAFDDDTPMWPSPAQDPPLDGGPHRRLATPPSLPRNSAPLVTAVKAALAPPSADMEPVDAPPPPDTTIDDAVPEPDPPPPAASSRPTVTMASGPAAILAADPAMVPLEASTPALPAFTPAKAPPPVSTAASDKFTPDDFNPATLNGTPKKRKKGRSFFKTIIVLAILGGIGAAGYVYGPPWYEEWRADEEATTPTVDEPEAPRAFPAATPAPGAIRSATFRLDGVSPASTSTYTVTTDFETTVSRVLIDRKELPDLEVLTLFDDAVVRRMDQDVWYQVPRGQFPLDDQPQRELWVRYIDEVLPPAMRDEVTIEASTRSEVNGVPARRLVVSLDPALLAQTPTADFGQIDPMGDIATAATVTEPDEQASEAAVGQANDAPTSVPVAATAGSPVTAAPTTAADTTAAPTSTLAASTDDATATDSPASTAAPTPTVQLELWIDGTGVVRKSSGAPQLGAETITVLETSPEPWLPEYPSPELLQPLTAETLLVLGL